MYYTGFLLAACGSLALAGHMKTIHSWSTVDYTFPSEAVRSDYLARGLFQPENIVILDVDLYPGVGQKMFVTTPRLKAGTPATLSLVTDQKRNGSTLLQPYPDWAWHSADTCDTIISVFRTKIDECGRLWVIDNGVSEAFSSFNRICPPKILIFDLKTDKLIKKHIFPDSFVGAFTLPVTIVVDTREKDCANSFAYIADNRDFKLWVYDLTNDKSWIISNNLFFPDPFHGDFHINGEDFELMDGILGLALGSVCDGDRHLYFHSLSSVHESFVSCSVLRNSTLFLSDMSAVPRAFRAFTHTRSSQAAGQDRSDANVVFFGLVEENAVGCWNADFRFNKDHVDIAAKNDKILQFQSGLKVIDGQVFTVSNTLQKFINNRMPVDEVTQRINVGTVSELIRNTKCESLGFASGLARRWNDFTRGVFSARG